MNKCLVALLFSAPLFASTLTVVRVTNTQAIVRVNFTGSDGLGSCTIALTSAGIGANDVSETLFAGSSQCSRSSSVSNSGGVWLVLGKRTAEISASDNRRYSRALQALTSYSLTVTLGSGALTSQITTANLPSGITYNDARFDRANPGQYAWPNMKWNDKTAVYIDPTTGIAIKRVTGPGEIGTATYSANALAANFVAGSGWSCTGQACSYSGTTQGYVFLPFTSVLGTDLRAADYLQLSATLSGTAASVDVYLTTNGVTPIIGSLAVVQAVTGTPTLYTIGSTMPVLEAWRGAQTPPASRDDIRQSSGTINKTGTAVTWATGDYFRPAQWSGGGSITIGGTVCAVTSWNSDKSATLTSSACVADGSGLAYTALNFGFLIRNHAATSTTVVLATGPTWNMGVSGFPQPVQAGFYDLCSQVAVTGPTGAGYPCAAGQAQVQYLTGNAAYWHGVDGTVNLFGLLAASAPTGFVSGNCATSVGPVWDGLVGGRFYCVGTASVGSTPGLFYVQYSGTYAAVTAATDSLMPTSTATALTTNLDSAVSAFDANYSTFLASSTGGWTLLSWQPYLAKGALLLQRLQTIQNTPGWWAVWGLDCNCVVAAMSSYGGGPITTNRWHGNHSSIGANNSTWMVSTNNRLSNTLTMTSAALTASPYSTCPTNTVDPTQTGTANCTTVTLISVTPSPTLFGQNLQLGDSVRIDNECLRVLALSGTVVTLQRGYKTYFGGCNLPGAHAGTTILTVEPSASYEMVWNWADDPHGATLQMSYGATVREDPATMDCHYVFSSLFDILGCIKSVPTGQIGLPVRSGSLPGAFANTPFMINWDASFAGTTYNVPGNYNESHPSATQYGASVAEKNHFIDQRPYLGDIGILTGGAAVKVAATTYLYRVPAASFSSLSPRLRPLLVTTGRNRILVDVSPTAPTDTAADNYKFSVLTAINTCGGTGAVGDLCLNAPYVSQVDTYTSRFDPDPPNDLALTEMTHSLGSGTQVNTSIGVDQPGTGARRLTSGPDYLRNQVVYWNGRETPGGGWYWWMVHNVEDTRRDEMFQAQLPPSVAPAAANNGDFIPVAVKAAANASMPFVRVRFGYAENGAVTAYYCTPRQVDCTTSGTWPFVWSDETQTAQSLGSAAGTVLVPTLPGRVTYYTLERSVTGTGGWTVAVTGVL